MDEQDTSTKINLENEERTSDNRLSSPRNVLNILPVVERRPLNGRVIGTKSPHIPPMVKAIIGEAAHMAGHGENGKVAEVFGVHPNTVTAAKKTTGLAREEYEKNIHDAALDRIVGMFDTAVSPEALAKLETKDATKSMKDLAKVAETFGGKKSNVFNGPTLIIFTPSQHTEDDYDIIDIDAKEVK